MEKKYSCPSILLVVFRRDDLAKKMMDNIVSSGATRVYVACDAARENRAGEAEKVENVRRIIKSYSGRINLFTKFNDVNMGCARNMSSSISWFLEHEESGIILEDDCYPDQSFYPFCAELLERYKDDERVMQIAGYNYYESASKDIKEDYFFSYIGWQWGWATWRRAWKHFDMNVTKWKEFKNRGLHFNSPFFPLRNLRLDELANGINCDSWAYPWQGCMAMEGGLSVVPTKSLVVNIGVGYGCTHGIDLGKALQFGSNLHTVSFPLRHAEFVVSNVAYDNHIKKIRRLRTLKNWFGVRPKIGKILRKYHLLKPVQ